MAANPTNGSQSGNKIVFYQVQERKVESNVLAADEAEEGKAADEGIDAAGDDAMAEEAKSGEANVI